MPYKKIVVATDGSPTAEHAQRVAAALAKASRAQLILVHGCSHADRIQEYSPDADPSVGECCTTIRRVPFRRRIGLYRLDRPIGNARWQLSRNLDPTSNGSVRCQPVYWASVGRRAAGS